MNVVHCRLQLMKKKDIHNQFINEWTEKSKKKKKKKNPTNYNTITSRKGI